MGSGISGLAVAHSLKGQADVTLYEAGDYFGGHANTVDITLPTAQGNVTHGVDTGFLVFNERTYPNLINLFAELGVETALSDMSFSVQAPKAWGSESLEWSGTNLDTVFAQRKNLLRPKFIGDGGGDNFGAFAGGERAHLRWGERDAEGVGLAAGAQKHIGREGDAVEHHADRAACFGICGAGEVEALVFFGAVDAVVARDGVECEGGCVGVDVQLVAADVGFAHTVDHGCDGQRVGGWVSQAKAEFAGVQ